jgi:arylsulfatase A-like enzyme
VLENTLVIVTADHGEEFGEHGLFGHFISLHRAELEVPLLVHFPSRIPAGRAVTEPVSLRNIPATVVDLLGLTASSPFPGHSLARHWSVDGPREEGTADDPVQSELPELGLRSLRIGPKVYIWHADGAEQLFDVRADPAEDCNLVDAPDQRLALEACRKAMRALDAQAEKDSAREGGTRMR